jgi:hypothetical protein
VPVGFRGDFGDAIVAYGNTVDFIDDHRETIDPLV